MWYVDHSEMHCTAYFIEQDRIVRTEKDYVLRLGGVMMWHRAHKVFRPDIEVHAHGLILYLSDASVIWITDYHADEFTDRVRTAMGGWLPFYSPPMQVFLVDGYRAGINPSYFSDIDDQSPQKSISLCSIEFNDDDLSDYKVIATAVCPVSDEVMDEFIDTHLGGPDDDDDESEC